MAKNKEWTRDSLDKSETFPLLDDYMDYLIAILNRASSTVRQYHNDLKNFFRFLLWDRGMTDRDFTDIDISGIDEDQLRAIELRDFHAFLGYLTRQRHDGPATRRRKVSALKSFFGYLTRVSRVLETDPTYDLEAPSLSKRLPRYLTLDESERLLDVANSENDDQLRSRDSCILTLFLNCGLRLSELVSIDRKDIRGDTLKVIGKGDKERTIYLNAACLESIRACEQDRKRLKPRESAGDALFISREGNRMSPRAVQVRVKKLLRQAGIDTDLYSTHKLRHTAATLLHKYGKVDIRDLQLLLGHESVQTTEIYTHVDDESLRTAIRSNPLADYQPETKRETGEA